MTWRETIKINNKKLTDVYVHKMQHLIIEGIQFVMGKRSSFGAFMFTSLNIKESTSEELILVRILLTFYKKIS